jgi:SAM-dependent methyltransferase
MNSLFKKNPLIKYKQEMYSIYSLATSKNPNKKWLQTLTLFGILFVLLFVYNRYLRKSTSSSSEGFIQTQPFVMKQNSDIYDTFYSQVYDLVIEPNKSGDFIISHVIKLTNISPSNSVLLDAGCGTGYLVNKLTTYGYNTMGVDRSKAMIDYAKTKYPDINVSIGDLEDPMTYNTRTFTHILCNEKTVYEIKDKVGFFRNCHHWLQSGGFFIIEIKDITKETNTSRHFGDFNYKSSMKQMKENNIVLMTEKFTDIKTSHVRENEQTYYVGGDMVQDIIYSGFTEYNKIQGKDGNGDHYLFKKR